MIIISWLLLAVTSRGLRSLLPYLSRCCWLLGCIWETVYIIYETRISRVSLKGSSPEGL
jgi:hypothetical protein